MDYNKIIDKEQKKIQPKNESRRILQEMVKNLSVSCKRREVDYAKMGEDLLNLCERLTRDEYYHNDNDLKALKELKEKSEEIKNWESIDYNTKIITSICKYLFHQNENNADLEKNDADGN